MTYLPYPDDPARLAATNPIFNDNSFVRGDEQRLNNSEIWANFSALDTQVETIVNNGYQIKGYINGGIEFDTASTFPFVRQGVYEVSGKLIYKTAIYNILVTDTFFDNLQAIDSYCAYLIMMNSSGTIKYLIYGEGVAQASQSVTAISGTTTKTLTVPAVPGSGTEQYIALISGTGSFTGAFKATRASATTFTIVLNSDLGSTFTGMTVTLYYKIRTLHGTGALANKTDTTSIVYSPSLGENTETNAFAVFDTAKNGFYCTLSGLTDYRVIGTMAGSTSSTTVQSDQIISFLSGRNKNDNLVRVQNISALVSSAIRWTTTLYAFGCDYIFYSNDATYGSWLSFQRGGRANARIQTYNSAAGGVFASLYFSPLSTGFTNVSNSLINDIAGSYIAGTTGSATIVTICLPVGKSSILKPLTTTPVTLSSNSAKFDCKLDILN